MAGEAPPPELEGHRLHLPADVRFAVRFNGHGDPVNPFMFHCHMLFHEDTGMMGQFRIVSQGQPAAPAPGHTMPHG
jgi:bilirubin oxidase